MTLVAIATRVIFFLALIVAATWVSHLIRDALDLRVMPNNEQAVHRAIMLGTLVYIVVLALPFMPGSEIGFAMLTAFGAAIVPLIYVATIVAMMLAYCVGRFLPMTAIVRLLNFLRLRRAADLIARAAPLSPPDRLAMLLEQRRRVIWRWPFATVMWLWRFHQFPRQLVIGGGGGIMLLAGMSGIFTPLPTFIAIAIAVSPVPIAVLFFGY